MEARREKYQAAAKQANRKKVLQALWRYSPLSRSDIAKMLGMNKATVTNIVSELLDENLIVPVGSRQDGVGRSSNMLMLNEKYGYIVGILITTIDTRVVISDIQTKILWEMSYPTERGDTSQFLGKINDTIQAGMAKCGIAQSQLLGVGISAPSIVDPSTGLVYATPILNLYNFPVGNYFRSMTNARVFTNSLGVNSARAERWFSDSPCQNVACVEISKGVGLGLIINGNVYLGSKGFAGADASHMILAPNGPVCTCGRRGCWETVGSLQALGDKTLEEAVAEADAGDVEAIQQLNRIGRYIGMGISNIIKITNPDRVVISGPITLGKSWIYNSVISTLQQLLWPHVFNNTSITFSAITGSPSIVGAIMSVVETIID